MTTDYELVILGYDEDLRNAELSMERLQKYADTLKHHIKAVAEKNGSIKRTCATLTTQLEESEAECRKLKRALVEIETDINTQSNRTLRDARILHIKQIEDLKTKTLNLKKTVSIKNILITKRDGALQTYRSKVLQQERELQENHVQVSMLTDAMSDIHKIQNEQLRREFINGECIICMDAQARYAQGTCGCMCYCAECNILVTHVIQGWSCPLCRQLNRHMLQIYNLPNLA